MNGVSGSGWPSVADLHGAVEARLDVAALRRQARRDPESALPEVARQFESLFVQMMLKGMRSASLGDPLFDSPGMDLYRDRYDQEMARQVSGSDGLGLARMMVQQLRGIPVSGNASTGAPMGPSGTAAAPVLPAPAPVRGKDFDSPDGFVQTLLPHARQAALELGVPAEILVAQAALETGWGQRMIRRVDGQSAHNLFGIKADSRWNGPRAAVQSQEYRSGMPVMRASDFRAYDSFSESFADYVTFLRSDPRYQPALAAGGDPEAFVRGLQTAGYATDPAYADKILNIWQRLTIKVVGLGPI